MIWTMRSAAAVAVACLLLSTAKQVGGEPGLHLRNEASNGPSRWLGALYAVLAVVVVLGAFIAGNMHFLMRVAHKSWGPRAQELPRGLPAGRYMGRIEGDFVIFIIGLTVTNWWAVNRWLPITRAFHKIRGELIANPDLGLLASESFLANPITSIQYWRSYEQLERYARSPKNQHQPAWLAFNRAARKAAGSGAVMIWHETYKVSAGAYETIYSGEQVPFGMGVAGNLMPIGSRTESSAQRIAASKAAAAQDVTAAKPSE